MAGTECPICSRTFASESIEEHAATCVGEEDDGSRVSPADEEVPTSAGPIGAPGPAAGAGADVGDVYVGTAGYNYTHWRKGAFYPRGLSQSNELKHYSGVFSAVEINASFHGVPREETLRQWASNAKSGFRFALKAPQDITHVARLVAADNAIKFFFDRVLQGLGSDALGPVLFQLPPSLPKDVTKIDALAAAVPTGVLVALEFRHPSWYCADVYAALRRQNFAICENVSPDASTHYTDEVTADWCYTRFHKNAAQEVTDYPDAQLKVAAARVVDRRRKGLTQYIFFLNDHEANAPKNARTLVKEVEALLTGPQERLVGGWRPDAVVAKGGRGSIEAMFATAASKSSSSPSSSKKNTGSTAAAIAASVSPGSAGDAQPSPAKRAKTESSQVGGMSQTSPSTSRGNASASPQKSPAKGATGTGSILNFFKKK